MSAAIQTDMAPLHIHRFGTGERIHYFGIHGWGGGWHTFEPLAEHLPADATLWSVDLPGYGHSDRLGRWRWETLAGRLADTMSSIDAPELHLVGNCSGAIFGLSAVQRIPDRFASLFLIDPFAFFPWYFRLLVSRGVGRMFYATAFENPIGRWLTNRGLAEHRTDDSDLTRSFEELDHGVVYQHLRMLQQIPGHETFAGLEMPIRIGYGENTFDAVRKSVGMWRELWPHADAVELTGAGHLPIEESTDRLASAVFDWDPAVR